MNIYLICAGLLGLLYAGLGIHVGRLRTAKKIWLGDGGDKELNVAIRAHGNFIEYVPLCLLLIFICSSYYGYRTIVGLSLILLASRVLHAGGILGWIPYGRPAGAVGTTLVLAIVSIWLALVGLGIRLY
jgi:uncharacterized membrane protein YecN with MAPEG domain